MQTRQHSLRRLQHGLLARADVGTCRWETGDVPARGRVLYEPDDQSARWPPAGVGVWVGVADLHSSTALPAVYKLAAMCLLTFAEARECLDFLGLGRRSVRRSSPSTAAVGVGVGVTA